MIAKLIIIALYIISLSRAIAHDGESKGNYDKKGTIIAFIVYMFLFYIAGFFDNF